ncbi:MAG: DegQ family serine endoprotease, partial [Methyloligellaceae bacterium]
APIVKRVAPAVVNIHASRTVERRVSPLFSDPFFRRFFGDRGLGPRGQRVQRSLGSGVIIDSAGLLVTNSHVIENADEIKVTLSDRREFECDIVLKDERTDLAVLRIRDTQETFPYLEFSDSDAVEVGDLVLAIGDPFGVGQTVTNGIVSALSRTQVGISDYQFFIQTDAAINPGNSGGALVDMNGRLVGVNTAIYSRTGGSHGIGFAIPANMVNLVVQSAMKGDRVKRPWFGARLQPVTSDIAESLGLDRPVGALIKRVEKSSPAGQAKLRAGDVIVTVDGKQVADPRAFRYRFTTKGIGGKTALGVVREGKPLTLDVALSAAPENPPRNTREMSGEHPLAGARIANLSPALAEELQIDEEAYGVIVLDVRRGSAASVYKVVRRHDIIVRLNKKAVRSVSHLSKLVREPARRWVLTIKRKGRLLDLVLGG